MSNRFTPISSKASLQQALQMINQNFRALDAETYTKTVKQNGGSAVVSGKLSNGRYGEVFYDANNVPRILIGQAPNDGEPVIAVSVSGVDVLEALAE